jgi:hypothetical protein
MSFEVRKEGEVTVIDVKGQLIVGNRQELKQKRARDARIVWLRIAGTPFRGR